MPCEENLIDTFNFLLNLKNVKRTGWVKRNIDDPESIAESSFQSIAIAMVLSDLYDLNFEKMTKMLILQDIATAIAGDLTPYDKLYFEKDEIHQKAVEDFVHCFDKETAEQYTDLWHEYYKDDSLEAQITHEILQIEQCLQALEYELKGYKDMNEFWDKPSVKIKTPEIKDFFKKMKDYREQIIGQKE